MQRRAPALLTAASLLLVCGGTLIASPDRAATAVNVVTAEALHHETRWRFEPSLPYDALSFINALTGDPFYARYYGQSAARFRGRLSREAMAAVDRLFRRKQQFGFIYSAFTALIASTEEIRTLDELAGFFASPGRAMAAYRRTEYYRPSHGLLFRLAIARDTVRVIEALDEAGFEAYWRERKLPQIHERIGELESVSVTWNVIPEVERRLGEPVDGEEVRVFVLAFAQPHAAKLVGNQLLVDVAYSNELIAANTIHELMHPPVDWDDPAMQELVRRLDRSPLIRTAFDEHDPAFGYNQFHGAIEESIVRVLDQRIAERLGFATARGEDRWRYDDGGMHAFAGVLYALTARERYMETDEPMSAFLRRHFIDKEMTETELVALWEEGTGRR